MSAATGPIRVVKKKRGQIRADDDEDDIYVDALKMINTQKDNFRFIAKFYFLTWSQIGDTPNSALKGKMDAFGDKLKGVFLHAYNSPMLMYHSLVWCRGAPQGWGKALACFCPL